MEGRKLAAWFLTVPMAALCAGCWTTQPAKNVISPPGSGEVARPVAKKDDGPKRDPKPATELAYGRYKETEADSDGYKKNPEAQARLRDEARQAYQHAIKIDPNNIDAQRALARLYTKSGDYERANEMYKKMTAKHPKEAGVWFDLGMCHNRRKEFDDSVRCFTKALELDPQNRDYQKTLGFTLAWTGKLDQGLTHLTRAQGAAQAHLEIAYMMDQKEQRDQAIHHLRIALRENPQLQGARDLLNALENPAAPVARGTHGT